MQKRSNLPFLVKVSSIVYSITVLLFFAFSYFAAWSLGAGKTGGIYTASIAIVNVMVYIELLGYLAVLWFAFLCFYRKSKKMRLRQEITQEEKFPTRYFAASLVLFIFFICFMSAVLS